jgi:type VI secretion system protein ImpF
LNWQEGFAGFLSGRRRSGWMKTKSDGYFQISLMNVFRQAALDHDAKTSAVEVADDGGRILSKRTLQRREGAGEDVLRRHLLEDLTSLLGTVNLETVQSLDEFPFVQKSILNFGIVELSRHSTDNINNATLLREVKTSLLRHEPRLVDSTVNVKLRRSTVDSRQRVAFEVTAEMSAKPIDVPLEFVAEIDVGVGKIALSGLKVRP